MDGMGVYRWSNGRRVRDVKVICSLRQLRPWRLPDAASSRGSGRKITCTAAARNGIPAALLRRRASVDETHVADLLVQCKRPVTFS